MIAREHDRPRARPDPELVEHVRRVIADGLLADAQSLGDVGVVQAVGHEREHLAFARRQSREHGIARLAGLQERKHGVLKTLPRRFALEQDVVAGVELDKLGARNAARE
jgi:hypothetical protein